MHAMARIGETMAQVTFAMSRYSQKSDFADDLRACTIHFILVRYCLLLFIQSLLSRISIGDLLICSL